MRTITMYALGAACLVSSIGCSEEEELKPPAHRKVRYIVAEEAGGARERVFSGVVSPAEESRLSFQVSGRIEQIMVKMGDQVKSGQVIAKLDETDFKLSLQQERASLAEAQAQARRAEADYNRTSTLYANNGVSVQELDSARAERDSSKSSVSALVSSVQSLKRQLEYATLVARADGVIQEVPVEVNETINSGDMVARLQAGEELEIQIAIPESYVNRIKRDDGVESTITATGSKKLQGKVTEIGVPEDGGSAYPVRVSIDTPPDQKIESGMAAEVKIVFPPTTIKKGLFRVPSASVGEDRDGRFVLVVEKGEGETGTVKRVSVETGSLESGFIEVESGLSGGELVITAGVKRLYEGVTVVVPEKPETIAL